MIFQSQEGKYRKNLPQEFQCLISYTVLYGKTYRIFGRIFGIWYFWRLDVWGYWGCFLEDVWGRFSWFLMQFWSFLGRFFRGLFRNCCQAVCFWQYFCWYYRFPLNAVVICLITILGCIYVQAQLLNMAGNQDYVAMEKGEGPVVIPPDFPPAGRFPGFVFL